MINEYEGVIAEIIFHNSENGYTVAVFEPAEDCFTIVGTMPGAAAGKSCRIQGEFIEDPRYGEQFKVSAFEEIMPSTKEGIRTFCLQAPSKAWGRRRRQLLWRSSAKRPLISSKSILSV